MAMITVMITPCLYVIFFGLILANPFAGDTMFAATTVVSVPISTPAAAIMTTILLSIIYSTLVGSQLAVPVAYFVACAKMIPTNAQIAIGIGSPISIPFLWAFWSTDVLAKSGMFSAIVPQKEILLVNPAQKINKNPPLAPISFASFCTRKTSPMVCPV